MSRIHWKSRRNISFIIIICVLYLTIRIKHYEHQAAVLLDKVHPKEVWEFVADFSNMKYLNPTIVDFTILEESGNYEHWKYTVQYTEHLSHWPHLPNEAIAHFNVKANHKSENYYIYSIHRTCLFMGLYCLDAESEFRFSPNSDDSKGTLCEENVKYECPIILSSFCKREVVYQRNAIMRNLSKKF